MVIMDNSKKDIKILFLVYIMDFKSYLENEKLSSNTIKNHIRNIEKIIDLYGHDFILEYSDIDIVDSIKKEEFNLSQQLTLSNSLSKFYKYNELSNDHIVNHIAFLNNELKKKYIKRNRELQFEYTKKDLIHELNNFYNIGEWKKYIISYLLIYLNTRNEDLNIEIVKNLKNSSKEYNNLIIRKNDILYIRCKYKTQSIYGDKRNQIKSKKFYKALSMYFDKYQNDNDRVYLFDKFYNSTNQIKKHTPFNLMESTILKIILKEQNTLHKANKISIHRGTNLQTLENNYNINR